MMKKLVVLAALCLLTVGAEAHKKNRTSVHLPRINPVIDVRVSTYLSSNLHDADVEVSIGINEPAKIVTDTAIVRLYDEYKLQISPTCRIPLRNLHTDPLARYNCVLELQNPILWSIEQPRLYTLDVEVDGQHTSVPCGIRRMENHDGKIYVNNQRTTFKGVCFHPRSPLSEGGEAIVSEKVICQLKRNNVNTIFTHHRTANDQLQSLCDAYGIYLIGAENADMRQYATLSAMQHDDQDRRQWGEPIVYSTCNEKPERIAAQLLTYSEYVTERSQRITGIAVTDSCLMVNGQLIKRAFQNVRFHINSDTLLVVENRYTQTDLAGYRLCMQLTRNGKRLSHKKLRIHRSLEPGQQYVVCLPFTQPHKEGDYELHITLSQPVHNAWAPKGHTIASAKLSLWRND